MRSIKPMVVHNLYVALAPFIDMLLEGKDFDDEKYKKLINALELCKREWAFQDCIPKVAFSLLLDLPKGIEDCIVLYANESSAQRVREAYLVIHTLLAEVASVDLDTFNKAISE